MRANGPNCVRAYLSLTPRHGRSSHPKTSRPTRLWITAVGKHGLVTDLKLDELKVFVGKEEQPIQALSFNPPGPLNLGLLIDDSGSRSKEMPDTEKGLAPDFFRKLLVMPGDQFFIFVFNDVAYLMTDLTDSVQQINEALRRAAAWKQRGGTVFYDTLVLACDQKSPAVSKHRAIVVITDGEDNASRHTLDETVQMIRQTGTILYIIEPGRIRPGGLLGRFSQTPGRVTKALNRLANVNGGMLFEVTNKHEMADAFDSMATALRSQYALDLAPSITRVKGTPPINIECSRPGVKILAPNRQQSQP